VSEAIFTRLRPRQHGLARGFMDWLAVLRPNVAAALLLRVAKKLIGRSLNFGQALLMLLVLLNRVASLSEADL